MPSGRAKTRKAGMPSLFSARSRPRPRGRTSAPASPVPIRVTRTCSRHLSPPLIGFRGVAPSGLGRGQAEWHGDALGSEIGDPLAVLEETVALLRQWWQAPHRASSPEDGHFRVRGWSGCSPPSRPCAGLPGGRRAAGADLAGCSVTARSSTRRPRTISCAGQSHGCGRRR